MGDYPLLSVFCLVLICVLEISLARDTISLNDPLLRNETIVSSLGTFEMGFFSPPNSKNSFIGIWYKKIPTKHVVWVVNRVAPLSTNATSVVLRSENMNHLALLSDENDSVWSVNASLPTPMQNPVMQLLDSGNLVVKDGESFLWQSFDYPTNTLLPGMRMGTNFVTGHEVYLSAWRSDDDPAPSRYTANLIVSGYPQGVIKNGTDLVSRSGPWDGVKWSGISSPDKNPIYRYGLFINKTEISTDFYMVDNSAISVLFITSNGIAQRWLWREGMEKWVILGSLPTDDCDRYRKCGPNGICNLSNFPSCGCLDHFVPRNRQQWNMQNFSRGCERRVKLDCRKGTDGFLKYPGIKLPDTQHSWYNEIMTLQECERVCKNNCSCTAYSSINVRNGGSGCLLWFGDLIDIKQMSDDKGNDIYIRLSSSELASDSGFKRKHGKILKIVAGLSAVVVGLILLLLCWMMFLRMKKKKKNAEALHDKDFELPILPLSTIARATNNFSSDKKLGEGGFGPVYKGVLENGQEIAVKRLSKASVHGAVEFKNEVIFIAKLQHRNLVSILGCCIEGEEQMLIYEYMPNRSLDLFIFDQTKKKLLDWPKRFNIINGIARCLMYLHQDSRLRIIHRDLKANNVLLDIDMNPKISDFGLARSVGGNETGSDTSRVVGTHGYMSPEYAVLGIFSIKSDVFSFGVSVLEIVSGKRNKGFSLEDQYHTLLGHTWKLYREGRSNELVDDQLAVESVCLSHVLRSIHVALLCVQQHPDDRPTMSDVVTDVG